MRNRLPILLLMFIVATTARADWNSAVLAAIDRMPEGGGYAVTSEAGAKFRSAVEMRDGTLEVSAHHAKPSYCSSATYLLLLEILADAQRTGKLNLPADAWTALAPKPVRDGHGIWGRWNANGPGTARLFHALGAGRNFTDYDEARPGDFLKIFWRDAVGKNERGHLVVYLGREVVDGEERVSFWSSNKPVGYGEKSVKRSEIARTIFSRLEEPGKFARAAELPAADDYLATLLTVESSFDEACALSGIR